MSERLHRIGLIVPSSNTTMEAEVPALLRTLAPPGGRFTCHSARVRMLHVCQEDLERMNADADRAVDELTDAPLDAVAFACLVAIMAMGNGHHRAAEAHLSQRAAAAGRNVPIVTSAGALVEELRCSDARRVALVMPYADVLARRVADYLEAEGFTVVDYVNLGVTDNAAVARIPGETVLSALDQLDTTSADHVVLSACVQMPSLGILTEARRRVGVPVTTAAECTARHLLRKLHLATAATEPAPLTA